MQFSSREDIEAPIDRVFAMLSEFEAFERSAIRRGIEVQRTGAVGAPETGLGWDAEFDLRGRRRKLRVNLVSYEPPNLMRFELLSQGLDGETTIDLMALSPRRTRLEIRLELKPRTLPARLLLQSLKLARAT